MLKIREELQDLNPQETAEWIESLDEVIDSSGPDRARYLIEKLMERAGEFGVSITGPLNTPYINTIPPEEEVPYPGDRDLERRIRHYVRWNALAMVVRANKYDDNIGGHISTYASLGRITFSAPPSTASRAIWFTIRGMLRRACMRGPTWKGGSRKSTWRISAMSCAIHRAFPPIRIPG
jgi:hypothetical protein